MAEQAKSWSWELPSGPPPRRALTEPNDSFGRTVAFTVLGTVVPGVGLIAARRRVVGFIVLGVFLLVALVLALWAVIDLQGLLSMAVQPRMLTLISVVLAVTAVAWVGVVVVSHLSLRGAATSAQRLIGAGLVGVLAFAVAAPMAVAARYSYDQASLVDQVFKSETQTKSATRPTSDDAPQVNHPDPWAKKARLNILLLGGDDGPGRTGTRTDTIMVASIDTRTGNTTLFSLPRNTGRMPFPENSPLHDRYPYGFTTGDGNDPEHFLNAMYGNVPRDNPADIIGATDNLGADAMKLSVGAALGLKIDYYVLVNLKGFTKLVDALGGITVNVNSYVPIGGNTDLGIPPKVYISPGENKHLDGRDALWFARGRYGSDDFVRMGRQRCVVNAIIKQANPANVLTRYEQIAKAGKEIVKTDMPQEVLPAIVELSMRVKNGNVRSVLFQHGVNGFSSPNPNFELMRQQVKVALGETKKAPTKKPSSKKPSATSTSAPKSTAPTSEDVDDICAYDAVAAANARMPG